MAALWNLRIRTTELREASLVAMGFEPMTSALEAILT